MSNNTDFTQSQKDFINKTIHKELTKQVLSIKDDISKKFYDYDNKMVNYLNELDSKINLMNEKYLYLLEEIKKINIEEEKINSYDNKLSNLQFLIAQHDIRINNLIKDLNDACYKYDIIFLNNLQVPGQIGDCCKFKNLKEYLLYTMKEFSLIASYKEKNQMNLNSYKQKLDSITVKLNSQVDNFLKTSFQYTISKVDEVKKDLKNQIDIVNAKIPELSFQNSNFAKNTEIKINELIQEREDLKRARNDFKLQLDNYFEKVELKSKESILEIMEYKKEFGKIKKNFAHLIEFIKDIRFKRNIHNEEIMNVEIGKLVTNLKKTNNEILEKKNKKFNNVDSIVKQIITGKKKIRNSFDKIKLNVEKSKELEKFSFRSNYNGNEKNKKGNNTNNLLNFKDLMYIKRSRESTPNNFLNIEDLINNEKSRTESEMNNEKSRRESDGNNLLSIKNIMNNEKSKRGSRVSSFTNEKIKEYSVTSLIYEKDMINNNEKNDEKNKMDINVKENKIKNNKKTNDESVNENINKNTENIKEKNTDLKNISINNSINPNINTFNIEKISAKNKSKDNEKINDKKDLSNSGSHKSIINSMISNLTISEKENNYRQIENKENIIEKQLSLTFNNNLKINLNYIEKNKKKSNSLEIPSSKRNIIKKSPQLETEEDISKNENDLIKKLIELNSMNIKTIQSQTDNKIHDLENKINLLNSLNNGLKKKVSELESKKIKLEKKVSKSNKLFDENCERYLLTDINNYDDDNFNLVKFKDKRFPPSKVKSKILKKSLINNFSDKEIKKNNLFELRSQYNINHNKKKKLPSKLLIEKFEKKRNEDKILYEIYHNHSMKFLKPLKNSFTKIPQTNIINQGK